MARSSTKTNLADPVRPYLHGVAKHLVDQTYGPNGPAWGTRLTQIEDTIGAIREVLAECMLKETLQRQANTAESRPEAFRCCPQCGKEVQDKDADPRIVQTRVGEAEWKEPQTYCPKCRRSFFPSDQEPADRSQ